MRLDCAVLLVATVILSVNARSNEPQLIEPMRPSVRHVVESLESVPMERKRLLSTVADYVLEQFEDGEEAQLVFVCTHNSRRSHLAQIWCQCAAYYYNIPRLKTYSGGTEVTACNIRTVQSLRRAGLSVVATTDGLNPVYLVQFSETQSPIRTYSKLYTDESNPSNNFAAMMCCSDADEKCPVVKGSAGRFPLHYEDPKVEDNTPGEAKAYDQRSLQIAQEMFFLMSEVSKRLN